MINQVDPKMMKQLKAILAHIGGATNENEIAGAATAAARLSKRHGLTLERFQTMMEAGDKSSFSDVVLSQCGWPSGLIRGQGWHMQLAEVLSKAFDCSVVTQGTEGLLVVGFPDDVATFSEVFLSLGDALGWLALHRTRGYIWELKKQPGYSPQTQIGTSHHPTAWRHSFLLGVVRGVSLALDEMVREEAQSSPSSMALTAVKSEVVDKALNNFFPKLETRPAPDIRNRDAFFSGKRACRQSTQQALPEKSGGWANQTVEIKEIK